MRIGTRDSKLAVWQATKVQSLLKELGHSSELVLVKSPGDKDLTTPLHQFANTGIFTKVLDDALLNKEVDIAVHSLKDYPTLAPSGIILPAVLPRAASDDILVTKGSTDFLKHKDSLGIIATGSIRRRAQWLSRYPNHQMADLRGNVQTRLRKLEENPWNGAVFAKAGLERIDILPQNHIVLDWMIPAPAQGAISIACRENDTSIHPILEQLNHPTTADEVKVERDFLRTVEGGCSAPVGALAQIEKDNISLKAGVFSLDGKTKVIFAQTLPLSEKEELGSIAARQVLDKGGKEIMLNIKNA